MNRKRKRRRILVDRKVQGALAVRVVIYWAASVLSLALLTACWIAITEGPMSSGDLIQAMTSRFAPVLGASLLLLPIIILDSLRQTNKFAGPMYRVRKEMERIANGKSAKQLRFRKGDFWYDFAEVFNQAVSQMQQCQTEDQSDTDLPAQSEELISY